MHVFWCYSFPLIVSIILYLLAEISILINIVLIVILWLKFLPSLFHAVTKKKKKKTSMTGKRGKTGILFLFAQNNTFNFYGTLHYVLILNSIFVLFFKVEDDKVSEFDIWHGLANLYASLSYWKDAEICLQKARDLKQYSAATLHTRGKNTTHPIQSLHFLTMSLFILFMLLICWITTVWTCLLNMTPVFWFLRSL